MQPNNNGKTLTPITGRGRKVEANAKEQLENRLNPAYPPIADPSTQQTATSKFVLPAKSQAKDNATTTFSSSNKSPSSSSSPQSNAAAPPVSTGFTISITTGSGGAITTTIVPHSNAKSPTASPSNTTPANSVCNSPIATTKVEAAATPIVQKTTTQHKHATSKGHKPSSYRIAQQQHNEEEQKQQQQQQEQQNLMQPSGGRTLTKAVAKAAATAGGVASKSATTTQAVAAAAAAAKAAGKEAAPLLPNTNKAKSHYNSATTSVSKSIFTSTIKSPSSSSSSSPSSLSYNNNIQNNIKQQHSSFGIQQIRQLSNTNFNKTNFHKRTISTTSPEQNQNKEIITLKRFNNYHPLQIISTKNLSSISLKNNKILKKTKIKMADQAVVDKLEAGFAKLQAATPDKCHSLLKKYLTREVLDKLKTKKTAMGATLLDVAQSGFENLDSGVGIYAPDAESYTLFADLFNPIIQDYHGGFKPTDKHPASDFGDLNTLVNVDPQNEFVISTRVRCGRSLQGYPFNPCLTEQQYKEMEQKVTSAFKEMEGDLAGTYYPLTGMTKETQQQLIDDHFLFKEGDRFLQAANACRYWPTGRGIYHNSAKTFLVWVNEEDHLRIISMQKGGDLKEVFGRLVKGARAIEAKVPFSRDDRLGFLTFCPTNLGTTIRASVHIKLPKLAADRKKLEEVAGRYNLQVRGTSGEHTESIGGIYDISNKRRLGLTEYQAVREMQDGILELIKIEKSL